MINEEHHRFNDILAEFPKDIELEKFLFQDESLLWAQRLPFHFRFHSLGVILCILVAGFFIALDIIILTIGVSPLGLVVASLPLPLIFFSTKYVIHRVFGSQIQVVTNYRIMQCTVKFRSFFIRSLSFHVVQGMIVTNSTIEFSVKHPETHSSFGLRSMVFRGVKGIHHLETLVQRQLHSSLSEFQYPPNIDPDVNESTLPGGYRHLLHQIVPNPSQEPILWISSLPTLGAPKSVLYNIILAEAWTACIVFSPTIMQPSLFKGYTALTVFLVIATPVVMLLLTFLRRVDVLTSKSIAFFYYALKFCGYAAQVETLDYRESFPHSCEINFSDNSGTINFENLPPKGLSMVTWPDLLTREELIFRKHCLAFSDNSGSTQNI